MASLFKNFSWLLFLLPACTGSVTPAPSQLPPSATDLDILGSIKICETKTASQHRWKGLSVTKTAWGTGEELYVERTTPTQTKQWLFFNEDNILVGAVVNYPNGIDLEPYPTLRQTLTQLTPTREFYLDASHLLRGTQPDSAQLYRTGDETTTTQYIVRRGVNDEYGVLLVAAVAIDPYEHLLEGSQKRFLSATPPGKEKNSMKAGNKDQSKNKIFLATQQFARGEVSLFKSCGEQDNSTDIAIDAYSRAVQIGFKNSNRLAEAHHRKGLALRNKGRFVEAQRALEESLKIRPHAPGVLNSLGSVLVQLDKPTQAIASLEKAIVLKPNYARARYNLAQAYETINPQRAREEYETYLVLVEGIPEESTRAALAKDRLQRLK